MQELERLLQADLITSGSSAPRAANPACRPIVLVKALRILRGRRQLSVDEARQRQAPDVQCAISRIARLSLSSSGSGISIAAISSIAFLDQLRPTHEHSEKNFAIDPPGRARQWRRRPVARRAWQRNAGAPESPGGASRTGRTARPNWNSRSRRNAAIFALHRAVGDQAGMCHQPALEIGASLRRIARTGAEFRLPQHLRQGPRRARASRRRPLRPRRGSANPGLRPAAAWQNAGCGPAAAAAGRGRARAARRAGRRRRRRSTTPARARAATAPASCISVSAVPSGATAVANPARCSAITSI